MRRGGSASSTRGLVPLRPLRRVAKIVVDAAVIWRTYFARFWLLALANWPFMLMDITLALYVWYFYNVAFAKSVADPLAYVLLGLMANTYIVSAMEKAYSSFVQNFTPTMSIGGLRVSPYEQFKNMNISIASKFLCDIAISLFGSTVYASVFLVVAVLVFNLRMSPAADPLLALLSLVLGWVASVGVGLVMAITIWIAGSPIGFNPLISLLSRIINIVCGVYFPVETLPEPARAVAAAFPQTYAIKILRATLLQGLGVGDLLPELRALVLLSLAYIALGVCAARWYVRRILEGRSPIRGFA